MLRQSDRKCLKSFLADTGENQRDFKGVSQKQADAVALCVMPRAPPPPPPPRWHTQAYPLVHIHTHTHIQTATHGLAVTIIQWHAALSEGI